MAIVGHDAVRQRLSASLPPVSLFCGPRSVGKWALANEVAGKHGVDDPLVRRYELLRIDHSREIVSFVSRRSAAPKGVLVRLDGATSEALNALLKVLEEPPGKVHFLLTTSHTPLLTLASRAQVFRVGYLYDEEVARILVERYRIDPDKADVYARSSNGQVFRAMEVRRYEENKGPVLSVLKGAAEGNEDLFWSAISGKREATSDNGDRRSVDAFGEVQWSLLRRWATEALTGRWRTFSPAESYGLQRDQRVPQRILRLVGVRPRVGVEAALLPFVLERRLGHA